MNERIAQPSSTGPHLHFQMKGVERGAEDRPCADELASLVQAVRDHARTTRKLADVTAERDAANERLAAVEAVCAEWDARLRRDMADEDDVNMVTVTYGAASRRIRESLADPEGGT